MYVTCPCLNIKVHLGATSPNAADSPKGAQSRQLAFAGVVVEQPFCQSRDDAATATRTVSCANCNTAVYSFPLTEATDALPQDARSAPIPTSRAVQLGLEVLSEAQAQAIIDQNPSYSPVYRFIIDYCSTVNPGLDSSASVKTCLRKLPADVVRHLEQCANDYIFFQRQRLAQTSSAPLSAELRAEQARAKHDAVLLLEHLYQAVSQGDVTLSGPCCKAESLHIVSVDPTQSTDNPTTAITTEGNPDDMLRSLPRRGSVAAMTHGQPNPHVLQNIIDPRTHIPLPPTSSEGRTDDELAAMSVYYSQLEKQETLARYRQLQQLQPSTGTDSPTTTTARRDSLSTRTSATSTKRRPSQALPAPGLFEFDREEDSGPAAPTTTDTLESSANDLAPSPKGAGPQSPKQPRSPALARGATTMSSSYAPNDRRFFHATTPGGSGLSRLAVGASFQPRSVAARPPDLTLDPGVDFTQDLDRIRFTASESESASGQGSSFSQVEDQAEDRLYPMGKPFSHRADRFLPGSDYPVMSKNRQFDVAGGPAHYRRIRHRLLNPQAQSDEFDQGSDDPEALGIVSESSDSEPDHGSSREPTSARPTQPHGARSRHRPQGHGFDAAQFATSMPVRVPGLANTYRVTKEERDYIINRQLYASTYYQSQAANGESVSGRGRSATVAMNPKDDDWDPIAGAQSSSALSAVEESGHDDGTSSPDSRHHHGDDLATDTTEATAIPMTYGRPRFSRGRSSHGSTDPTHHDPLFRGAQSFIPPHELAAMSYAADTNNLFGSKPPDVFRGRMNI
ncbi:hypothetical protein H4R34_003268 [Dimargaris verticillata]|uniref:Uncharacterized protein n=1 Tax=Dimargaris verticillata TaxID=2761393 RepID=A0A9W8B6K0_9FUNG|nr:hypothetical protein H4R34_003268 [Dimargaris verticillata]